jgi:hypothetical protein
LEKKKKGMLCSIFCYDLILPLSCLDLGKYGLQIKTRYVEEEKELAHAYF